MNAIRETKGSQDSGYKKLHESVLEELTAFRFSAKQVEALCEQVRGLVEEVRGHERKVMDFCVEKSGMPRPHFIKSFPGNEINLTWLDVELALEKPYIEKLVRYKHSIIDQQDRLIALQIKVGIPIKELKEINKQMTTGEARARRRRRLARGAARCADLHALRAEFSVRQDLDDRHGVAALLRRLEVV